MLGFRLRLLLVNLNRSGRSWQQHSEVEKVFTWRDVSVIFILVCVCWRVGSMRLPWGVLGRGLEWFGTLVSFDTLENRYGFWPQTGCVTVPGCEAAFLVARQRFPYRSRFNFSVKTMENMLPGNAICDMMHIDFSRKIYCGANDASIGF